MYTANRVVFALAAVALAVSVLPAAAEYYFVSADGLGDFPTIQAAVDAAVDGDVILLTAGTFTGDGNRDIVVPSKNIAILSQDDDPTLCIIDCEGSARAEHRGFHFTSTGTGSAELYGIAVINGYTTSNGGGIWIEDASPRLENCAVGSCVVVGSSLKGGGIYVEGISASPTIIDCIFTGNTADYGGGIGIGSGGYFEGCTVIDNTGEYIAGGIYIASNFPLEFVECEIVSNTGWKAGGLRMAGNQTTLTDCVIARNDSEWSHSGGIWLQSGDVVGCTIVDNTSAIQGANVTCLAGTGTLENCIVAFGAGGDGDGIYAAEGYQPTVICCDVYGNAGDDYGGELTDQTGINGNIMQDPEICGIGFEDYQLFDTSPCLPGGNGCGVLMGALGVGCDSPVEERSWGTIKAMYR